MVALEVVVSYFDGCPKVEKGIHRPLVTDTLDVWLARLVTNEQNGELE